MKIISSTRVNSFNSCTLFLPQRFTRIYQFKKVRNLKKIIRTLTAEIKVSLHRNGIYGFNSASRMCNSSFSMLKELKLLSNSDIRQFKVCNSRTKSETKLICIKTAITGLIQILEHAIHRFSHLSNINHILTIISTNLWALTIKISQKQHLRA